MPKYAVTITAKVTKTLNVEAADAKRATELAHEAFSSVVEDGQVEAYNESCDGVALLDDSTPCEFGED